MSFVAFKVPIAPDSIPKRVSSRYEGSFNGATSFNSTSETRISTWVIEGLCSKVEVICQTRRSRAVPSGGTGPSTWTFAMRSVTSTGAEGTVVPAGIALLTASATALEGPSTRPSIRWEARRREGNQRGSAIRASPEWAGKYRFTRS